MGSYRFGGPISSGPIPLDAAAGGKVPRKNSTPVGIFETVQCLINQSAVAPIFVALCVSGEPQPCLSCVDRNRKRHIGNGGPVKIGQKCRLGPLQPRLQAATSGDAADAAADRETFDHRLTLLQHPRDIPSPDVPGRSRHHRATARTASGGGDPGLRHCGHDLGQVMAQQNKFISQFRSGKGAIRQAGHAHQRPQINSVNEVKRMSTHFGSVFSLPIARVCACCKQCFKDRSR